MWLLNYYYYMEVTIMSIYEKLALIQKELKAPKGQYNSFGNYKYRSCEDIVEAAKPICISHGTVLVISDEMEMLGTRYYVKATAILYDTETEQSVYNIAYAREEEVKKGMDSSQITGAASSYARKYALNGLFCIDDTKDADTNTYHEITTNNTRTAVVKEEPSNIIPFDEPVTPVTTGMYVCSECGDNVKPNVAKYSISRYKRCICYSCQQRKSA